MSLSFSPDVEQAHREHALPAYVGLVLILLVDFFLIPNFFSIQLKDGHLYGSLIDILVHGSPTMVLAIGMTLVIATGGVDLSVGAIMAISASVACHHDQPDDRRHEPDGPETLHQQSAVHLDAPVGRDHRCRSSWPRCADCGTACWFRTAGSSRWSRPSS